MDISTLKFKSSKVLPFIFIIAYLSIFLLDNYGSVDKSISQWLFVSIINISALFFIFYYKFELKIFNGILKNKFIIIFSLFLFVSLLSSFFSFNLNESLIKITFWINFLLSIIFITYFISAFKLSLNSLITIFLLLFLLQLYYSLDTYIQIISLTAYDFSYASLLKGVASNKNITSALFVFQLPILLFYLFKQKNIFFKFLISLFLFLFVLVIFLLSSRSAYISLVFVFCSSLIYFLIDLFKTKRLNTSFFFILIPFIISFVYFQSSNLINSNLDIQNRISTINTQDESTATRLRFYQHAIDYITSNPFTPLGPGNWKIKSIELDQINIKGYTVPYHVHNDFLEIATETSIFGLLLYLALFLILFKFLYKLYKSTNSNDPKKYFYFILSISLITYIIDSNLNFPHARALQQISLAFVVSIIISSFNQNFNRNETKG